MGTDRRRREDRAVTPTRVPAGRHRRVALALIAAAALTAGVIAGSGRDDDEAWRTATASTFGTAGDALACGGTLRPGQPGVAHRSLPCGTSLEFRHHGRRVIAAVIDRGPYVAGREFDLGPATASELGFIGVAELEWRPRTG